MKAEHAVRVAEEEMRQKEKVKKLKEKEIERMSQVRIEARERMKNKKMEKEREKCMFEMEQERIRSRRAEEAAQEIVRFRSRDRENLEIKLEEKRRKEEEEKIKQQRLDRLKQSVKVSVESDRNRLYRPTSSTTQRNKCKEEIIQRNLVMKIPHRLYCSPNFYNFIHVLILNKYFITFNVISFVKIFTKFILLNYHKAEIVKVECVFLGLFLRGVKVHELCLKSINEQIILETN